MKHARTDLFDCKNCPHVREVYIEVDRRKIKTLGCDPGSDCPPKVWDKKCST